MERITVNITVCTAALSANFLSFPPIALAINEFAPEPIPFPTPTSIINSGVMNPIAASASDPRPATHILSARLYAIIRSMETIIGTANLFIAFLGSPVIISILLFLPFSV